MATNINKKAEIAAASTYPENRLNTRERKVLEVSDQYVPAEASDWATAPSSVDAALDALAASNPGSLLKTATVTYDFSVDGGAISSIPLGVTLPDNAIVVEVIRDELTAADSAADGGTIILSTPTDGNLEQTALTADGSTVTVASSGGSAVPKKLTAARELQVTIASEALTAGKIQYFVRYFQGA